MGQWYHGSRRLDKNRRKVVYRDKHWGPVAPSMRCGATREEQSRMTEKNKDHPPESDTERPSYDEIDEELINLSAPPPDLRLAVFTVIILILSCVMAVWFMPEAKYLAWTFREPTPLGEAADIDVSRLDSQTYVTIDGFPLIQRTLTYKEGVKWFMLSDNMRKFFPLAGQPHIFVQWAESEEYKAYRDQEIAPGTLGPPSHFTGHLVRRDDLGERFNRVWAFYDCLDLHYLGRCNHCLGKSSLDECREAFTCAENNDKKACEQILKRSKGPLESDISRLEKSAATPEDRAKLADLKGIQTAQREQRIAVASVQLEELATRSAELHALLAKKKAKDRAAVETIRAEVAKLRLSELEVRAVHALNTVKTLDDAAKKEIRADLARLDGLREKQATQTEGLKSLQALVQLGEALDKLKKRVTAIQNKLSVLPIDQLESLSKWEPDAANGKGILDAVAALEVAIAEQEKAQSAKAPAESSEPEGDDHEPDKVETPEPPPTQEGAQESENPSESGSAADGDSAPADETPERLEPSPEMLASPAYQTLTSKLASAANRVSTLLEKLDRVSEGTHKPLEQWARKPDVLGKVPEAVRETQVVESIQKLEGFLKDIPAPSEGADDTPPTLISRLNNGIDALNATKSAIERIETRVGAFEVGVYTRLENLKQKLKDKAALSLKAADDVDRLINDAIQYMTVHNLYLYKLKGAPEAMSELEKPLAPKMIESLNERLEPIEKAHTNPDWVVIDGEIPLDKLWVLFIYAMLAVMAIINLRKLWRFWNAYRD